MGVVEAGQPGGEEEHHQLPPHPRLAHHQGSGGDKSFLAEFDLPRFKLNFIHHTKVCWSTRVPRSNLDTQAEDRSPQSNSELAQGSTGSVFYSLGRKWEGNNNFFWCGKEMGRKKVIMSVWEGNGKEIMTLVGMGG